MTEFEWRRQLRDLRKSVTPSDDLWTRVEQALATPSTVDSAPPEETPSITIAHSPRSGSSRRHWLTMGLAAAMVAVAFSWRPPLTDLVSPGFIRHDAALAHMAWKPTDPRLSGAAIELAAARLELSLALQQAPHSAALRQLLEHTNQQQTRLRQLDHENG